MKYLLCFILFFVTVSISYSAILTIDKDTFYETRGLFAGQQEVRLHFKDAMNIQQDVLTNFAVIPKYTEVITRLNSIKALYKPVPVIPTQQEIKLTDYSPKQIYDLINRKNVTVDTTWADVFAGTIAVAKPIGEVAK